MVSVLILMGLLRESSLPRADDDDDEGGAADDDDDEDEDDYFEGFFGDILGCTTHCPLVKTYPLLHRGRR